ncbi:MAG: hypothetical protein ACOCP4_02120 [Candidatus Woesearchaeota archaeon]
MVNKYTYLEIFLEDLNRIVNLNEFEKCFERPHQTVKRHLEFFVKRNILVKEKRGKFLFYKLNLENYLTKEYLVVCEKVRLFEFLEKPLFLDLYDGLSSFFSGGSFLIFGSSVKGGDFNDIDILVLDNGDDNIINFVNEYEETFSKKVELISSDFDSLSKSLVKEIRKKHIFLNNHEFLFEEFYDDYFMV